MGLSGKSPRARFSRRRGRPRLYLVVPELALIWYQSQVKPKPWWAEARSGGGPALRESQTHRGWHEAMGVGPSVDHPGKAETSRCTEGTVRVASGETWWTAAWEREARPGAFGATRIVKGWDDFSHGF
nr:hypothetical protein Iba_chr04cCG14350 [Ipomoea batatas]